MISPSFKGEGKEKAEWDGLKPRFTIMPMACFLQISSII